MAMSRSLGGTAFTTLPPIAISPPVMFSRPASMRSRVDLPQPDGPTRTTNSPSAMSTLTPCKIFDRAERFPHVADLDRRHYALANAYTTPALPAASMPRI